MKLPRRTLLQGLLGCAGLAQWRLLRIDAAPDVAPDLVLARRIASLVPKVTGLTTAASLPQLLAQVFGSRDLAGLLALDDAALERLVRERIQHDYRQGMLVRHQGWWLAHTEAALLQLGQLQRASG